MSAPRRLRRDPRGEKAATAVTGGRRPRFDLGAEARGAAATGPSGRPRRDPRGEADRQRIPGGARLRMDRAHRGGASGPGQVVAEASAPAQRLRTIAAPAFLVGAVIETSAGRPTPHARQVLGAARLLADGHPELGEGAVVAFTVADAGDLGPVGADRVLPLGDLITGDYDPEGLAAVLATAAETLGLRHLVFAETADGGDLARRVAARLGEGLFAGAESLTATTVTRAARARRTERRAAPPRLLTLAADAVAPHAGPLHEARSLAAADAGLGHAPEVTRGIRAARRIAADPAAVSLAEAEFVVSAGNGISDFAAFRDLVAALGATPGASRVVCDAGLMPRSAQVGASGTVLDAACYFALGIAGAPQHLQGVAGCEHVVAVNTDLHAAMIERAGLAIVADAQAVMPALLAALAAEQAAAGRDREAAE
ncbi:electron transfer flavoprotein subunit alpha/FixB family protein [Methylobrevis albus]|uniref:Electron transfer flavoprotein subunit alpha/FixB family protein n=1 Tax=Methylobrevis albus TaxID=2793297 RepID=A0A931I154_9HYPH|nr:electron transfer flavoprotein subunit alpha/FixB family protein [Methylobrevis albus]MBH0237378.1 electron transfer flavoprotein subunit alpha/FixB family protein [Methylobrevis albus]